MTDVKITIAAGCFGSDGYGLGFPDDYPFHLLAGVTLKTATIKPMECNREQTVWHGPNYSLNAVGLANPGLSTVLKRVLPAYVKRGCPVGVSILGTAPNEWREMAVQAERAGADYLELNLSCPNLPGGHASTRSLIFGLCDVLDVTTLPVHAKVGGDGRFALDLLDHAKPHRLVVGNTMTVGAVPGLLGADVAVCGMSGPPLLPVHLAVMRMVHRAAPDVHLSACGGIEGLDDVNVYREAGASSFQMGTAVLRDPYLPVSINA